jgi:preprotein translocase subunit SecG
MLETYLLINKAGSFLLFNYIVSYFVFDSMNFEGALIMLIILLITIFLVLIFFLKYIWTQKNKEA